MKGYLLLKEPEIERWLGDKHFEVVECCECGTCFQTFYPDADLATQLYDHWISFEGSMGYDLKRPSIAGYAPMLQEVVALGSHIERTHGLAPGKIRMLDYGMGWGSWVRIARAMGLDAYGYEVSPSRIEFVSKMGIPCLGDEELSQQRFHVINLEQVIEHVPDVAGLLARLVRQLEPGGLIKIGIPRGENMARLLRKHGTSRLSEPEFIPLRPLEHVNAFTAKSLQTLAHRVGLRPTRAPVLRQFSLVFGTSPGSFVRSIGRPFVRGVLGANAGSVVLCR